MASSTPQPVSTGDPIRADLFNALISSVNQNMITPGGRLAISATGDGVAIGLPRQRILPKPFAPRTQTPIQFRMTVKSKTEGGVTSLMLDVAGGFVNWGDEDIEVEGKDFPLELEKDMNKSVVWEAKNTGEAGELKLVDEGGEEEDVGEGGENEEEIETAAKRLIGKVKARVVQEAKDGKDEILAPVITQVKIDTIETQTQTVKVDSEHTGGEHTRKSIQNAPEGIQLYGFTSAVEPNALLDMIRVEVDEDGKPTGRLVASDEAASKTLAFVTRKSDGETESVADSDLDLKYVPLGKGASEAEKPPPCGHPGNTTETTGHPGDAPGGGAGSHPGGGASGTPGAGEGGNTEVHPGDHPSPPCGETPSGSPHGD